ncbi:DUF4097 family beta strand repeat-containing protein [Fundicoccus sp. Sow4_F4]|uniref:DUF4097 family beta strand repeat-containing protein n=2 Tax=unclassified Fundicoccus TaxID=2761543 RepID=UPI003F8FC712
MKFISKLLIILSLFTIFIPMIHVDAQAVNDSATDDLPTNLLYESGDLEAFAELKIDLVSSYIEIQEGNTYKLEVYVSQEDLKFDDVFNLSTDKKQVVLNEKDWKNNFKSFFTTLTSRVVVTVPETEKLSVNVDLVNGEIKAKGTLTKFEFDGPNVKLFLSGEETYPMAVDFINGEIELIFETFNAELDFEFVNGRFEVLGDTMSATFSDFKKTLGDGKDAIQIDAVNGKVILREAD